MNACVLCVTLLLSAQPRAGGSFELASPQRAAAIVVLPSEPECVRLAAQDLAADVKKIAGRELPVADRLDDGDSPCVLLCSASVPESAKLIERILPRAAGELRGKWEAYRVETVVGPGKRPTLLVAGSDERGTMFGLYAFIEKHLGVDPLYFWSGREPARRERLAWEGVRLAAGEPTFRYRGWFINDEDLLSEWRLDGGTRRLDYPYYAKVVAPKVSRRVFESMLRLRFNLVIPASFVDIRNPDEARLIDEATRRGLFVSMHHVEPLGVSGFAFQTYWRERGENVPFSFVRHRDKFEAVWRDYAARWAKYPGVVWQIGLRGIADRPVWVSDPAAPKTPAERGKLISEAMALQWEIVRSVDRRPHPPATTTLWMEGAELHRQGHLRFPPGVAAVFADNGPGWQLQGDFHQVRREAGRPYGIYYHLALWDVGPHLVQAVSPQRMHAVFGQAVGRGSTHYAMLNVANVREFALGIDAASRLLADFPAFDPDRYLRDWCRARFQPADAAAERAYRRFLESYVVDAQKNSRHLLDGETVRSGKGLLETIRTRAGDKQPWNEPQRLERLLAEVQRHRAAVEAAGADNGQILAALQGDERAFFETNFVAQQQMLVGLLRWHEGVLRAGIALPEESPDAAIEHLRAAQAGLEEVRRAQALAAQGPWRHWYRGDRKMNLPAAARLTTEVIEQLQRRSAGADNRPGAAR